MEDTKAQSLIESMTRDPVARLVDLALFGINGGKTYPGVEPSEFTPAASSDYIFQEELLLLLLSWLDGSGPKGKNLSLYGPQGAGKTSGIFETAARTGHEVFHFSGADSGEGATLLGKVILKQGTMEFDPGPLLLAAIRGGILLIDEVDLLPPAESAMLNIALDGRPIPVPDGIGGEKYITPKPGFRVAVTSNTGGAGDTDRRYAGAKRQHGGFLDRFRSFQVSYMKPDQELTILAKLVPTLDGTIMKTMVETSEEVRRLFTNGELGVTLSTRTLHQWALDYLRFGASSSLADPLKATLNWSLPVCLPEDRESVFNILELKTP